MNRLILLSMLIAGVLIFLAIDMGLAYPTLPSQVVSKYDLQNRPCGWMGKDAFYGTLILIVVVVNGILGFTGWVVFKTPVEAMRLPYKRYWIANSEREARLKWKIIGSIGLFPLVMNIAVLTGFEMTYKSTMGQPMEGLTPNRMVLVTFIVILVLLVHLFVSLMPPKSKG